MNYGGENMLKMPLSDEAMDEIRKAIEKVMGQDTVFDGDPMLVEAFKEVFMAGEEMGMAYNEKQITQRRQIQKDARTLSLCAAAMFGYDGISPEQWWDTIKDESKTQESITAITSLASMHRNENWASYFRSLLVEGDDR